MKIEPEKTDKKGPTAASRGSLKPQISRSTTVPERSTDKPGPGEVSVSSSKLKNQFGEVLTQALSGHPVFITNRDQPAKVVLISAEKYHALISREKRALERLTQEFDSMLHSMQNETSRAAIDSLFSASSEELGRAAVEAKRKNG